MLRRIRKYLFLLPYGLLFAAIVLIFMGVSRWKEHTLGVMVRGEASEKRLPLSMFDGERFLPDSGWENLNSIQFRNDLNPALFLDPPQKYGPWLRWWWPGAWVDSTQLSRELKTFADKKFGGVDIQALGIGLDPDMKFWSQVNAYNLEVYHQKIKDLLPKAEKLNMGIDLSISSLSPAGGPHVGLEEGLQSLAFAEATILGDKIISMDIPLPEIPYFYQWMGWEEMFIKEENDQWASFRLDKLELLEVFASKTLEQKRSPYSIYLDDYIELDQDSISIITDFVQDERTLIWDAPPGYWKIIVVYKMPAAQSPWDYPGNQKGYVLDPFNSSKVQANYNFLLGQRTGFPASYGASFRGFSQAPFNFLVERLYSHELLAFFEKENSYSLTPYLPILDIPGKDNHLMALQHPLRGPEYTLTDLDDKIREDYARTLSDFFIQNYLDSTLAWANSRGLVSRITPYGFDLDILKAVGHTVLPEASQRYSGYGTDFVKMLSSGAELYGRPWVSSLCLDNQESTFSNSPADMKSAMDDLFLHGVNHLVLQGAPYQKIDAAYGKEAWMPFSSPFFDLENFSEYLGDDNPFWKYQDKLNAYAKRCQYMLRQGKSNSPILIYYPFLGFPGKKDSEFPQLQSLGLEEHESEVANWLEKTQVLIDGLDELGLSWVWVNDESLQRAKGRNGYINIGKNKYDRLILIDVPSIEIETLRNIVNLSKRGAKVLLLENPPQDVKGFHKYSEKIKELDILNERLPKSLNLDNKDDIQNYFSGFPVEQKLSFARPYRNLRATRRTGNNFELIFLKNLAPKDRFFELKIDPESEYNYLFNPWKGSIHELDGAKEGTHRIFLNSQSSAFIVSAKEEWVPDSLLSVVDRLDAPLLGEITFNTRHLDRWDFTMSNEAGTGSLVVYKDTTLFDWTQNDELKYCSEDALYSTYFELGDTLENKQYILDLGELRGAVEVSVNTEFAGVSIIPPYRMDISKHISPGLNTIEIWLVSPLKNRLIGRALSGDDRYERFEKSKDNLGINGLKGPVIIWEVDKNSELIN